MHKAELGQEQNKRTYKDGKDNMTVTCIHCPVVKVQGPLRVRRAQDDFGGE